MVEMFPNTLFDWTLDMGHTRLDIKDLFIETVGSGTRNMERKQFQFDMKNWQNILLVKF